MNRITLGSIRATIAEVMNVCADSDKIPAKVNEAQERLMAKGKWVGTTVAYRICANSSSSCFAWPRQIETIEAWALCSNPGVVRNKWYEFSDQGPGLLKESDNWFRTLEDKDPVCCFSEIDTNTLTKRIYVTTTVPETAGLRILLQGYDQNAQWIRTIDSETGEYVDGEYVDLVNARTTVNYFTKLTGVQKPITKGNIVLSQQEFTTLTVEKVLAQYEPDETLPIYRQSFIPGMQNINGCGCACSDDDEESCTSKYITVIAKLRHIPVRLDTDWLVLGSVGALKLMVMAILKENRNLFQESMAYEARAIQTLQDELSSFEGDGALPTLKYEGSGSWGAGVQNAIGFPSYYRCC